MDFADFRQAVRKELAVTREEFMDGEIRLLFNHLDDDSRGVVTLDAFQDFVRVALRDTTPYWVTGGTNGWTEHPRPEHAAEQHNTRLQHLGASRSVSPMGSRSMLTTSASQSAAAALAQRWPHSWAPGHPGLGKPHSSEDLSADEEPFPEDPGRRPSFPAADFQEVPRYPETPVEGGLQLQIVMTSAFEGARVGLTLSPELEVLRMADPRAQVFGWRPGDIILKVNGNIVEGERSFLAQVHRAALRNQATRQPLVFDVLRPQAQYASHAPPPAQYASHAPPPAAKPERPRPQAHVEAPPEVTAHEDSAPHAESEDCVIRLNVGGDATVEVLRSTLCLVTGSRLAALFGRGWDRRLPKDEHGRVFMDSRPDVFLPLVDFLRECRLSADASLTSLEPGMWLAPPAPQFDRPEQREAFARQVRYFGLEELVQAGSHERRDLHDPVHGQFGSGSLGSSAIAANVSEGGDAEDY